MANLTRSSLTAPANKISIQPIAAYPPSTVDLAGDDAIDGGSPTTCRNTVAPRRLVPAYGCDGFNCFHRRRPGLHASSEASRNNSPVKCIWKGFRSSTHPAKAFGCQPNLSLYWWHFHEHRKGGEGSRISGSS